MKHVLNSQFLFFNLFIFFCLYIAFTDAIIGGEEATEEQSKFLVSIQENNIHICGGSIFSEYYVLSAASCFIDSNEEFKDAQYTIVAGLIDLKTPSPKGIIISVEKVSIPAEFKRIGEPPNENSVYHSTGDIAVLKLSQKLEINQNSQLRTIIFPPNHKKTCAYSNTKAKLSGYGITNFNNRLGSNGRIREICDKHCTKRKVAETIVTNRRVCQNMFNKPIDNKFICSRMEQKDLLHPEGACDGDIGGPLVLDDDRTIIGILTNTSTDCNERYKSSLYTRVSFYQDFVWKATIKERSHDIRIAVNQRKVNDDGIEEIHFVEMHNFI